MKNNWQTKEIGAEFEKNRESKIQQWQSQINEISIDVEDLLYSNYQAEELEKIIKANTFVKGNIGSFWEHYKLNLTYFLVSKIWHQIDENINSLSLINLLKDLLCNHVFMTSDWWVDQCSHISTQTFEESFGKESLDPSIVCQDIQELKEVTQKIKLIRHKRVAHTDTDRNLVSKISHSEIIKAVSQIEKLVIKYIFLLTPQDARNGLLPDPDDWKLAFTKEWITNEK